MQNENIFNLSFFLIKFCFKCLDTQASQNDGRGISGNCRNGVLHEIEVTKII